jgi:hypothetical protein
MAMISGAAHGQNYGFAQMDVNARPGAFAEYQKWRFSIDAAYSYLTADTPMTGNRQLDDFFNKMHSGVAYGADVQYFFQEVLGMGLRLGGHHHSNTKSVIKGRVNTFYAGPSIVWRKFNESGKGAVVLEASAGYVSYNEKTKGTITLDGENINIDENISKGALGTTISVGYDIRLGKGDTFLGIRVSLFGGKVTISDDSSKNINSIDLGAGLRF